MFRVFSRALVLAKLHILWTWCLVFAATVLVFVLLFTIAVVFVFGRLTHREKHNKMLKSNHMIPKIVTVCIRKTYAFVACISISQRKKLPTDRPFESTNIPNVRTNVKIQKIIERKNRNEKSQLELLVGSLLVFIRSFVHSTVWALWPAHSFWWYLWECVLCLSEHSVTVPKMQSFWWIE